MSRMSSESCAAPQVTDHLSMTGIVLAALESGRMRMHAEDYQASAAAATVELSFLETHELLQLEAVAHEALRDIVSNVISERLRRLDDSQSMSSERPIHYASPSLPFIHSIMLR